MKDNARVLILSLALLGGAAACGEAPGQDANAVRVRDSAGISVVESEAPRWRTGQGWRIAPEPRLDLGGADGGDPARQFDRVAGAVRLGDGTLVVADGGSRELRFFRDNGEHLRSAGGRGDGPGEFRELSWVGAIAGDSVVAWDAPNRRMSFFSREGRFVRAVTVEVGGMSPRLHGVFASGVSVFTPGWALAPPGSGRSGEFRDTLPLLRFDRHGAPLDTLGRVPGAETFVLASGSDVSTHRIPFGREGLVAIGGERWFAGDNAERSVLVREAGGGSRRVIRWAGEPAAVRSADVAAYYAGIKRDDSFVPPSLRSRLSAREEEARRVVPHRKTLPAFAALLPGSGGELWVLEPRFPADPQPRWSVFDADGAWLARVETPPGVAVLQVGRDWLVGLHRDDMDVEHVRLYRIERAADG